jgi:hypothetical protein
MRTTEPPGRPQMVPEFERRRDCSQSADRLTGGQSPLAQGRGSKRAELEKARGELKSPLTQGRGSKHRQRGLPERHALVASRAGARIETSIKTAATASTCGSPLAQGRGSKRGPEGVCRKAARSPLAQGRGSKRLSRLYRERRPGVASRAGAWIETILGGRARRVSLTRT